jgi:hypothetical protein
VDAAEFFDLVDTSLLKRFENLTPTQGSGDRRVYSVRGRTISVSAVELGGRPGVLYVDVPAGTNPQVVDPSRIVLEP